MIPADLTNDSVLALIILLCPTVPVTIAAFVAERLEKRRRRVPIETHGRTRLGLDHEIRARAANTAGRSDTRR